MQYRNVMLHLFSPLEVDKRESCIKSLHKVGKDSKINYSLVRYNHRYHTPTSLLIMTHHHVNKYYL